MAVSNGSAGLRKWLIPIGRTIMDRLAKRRLGALLMTVFAAGPVLAQATPPVTAAPVPASEAPGAGPVTVGGPTGAATVPANTPAAYDQGDVLAAAEGVFGKGAKGLAEIIERTFKERGRPNAYIVGREAGGAFVVGLRYGGGTLFHKIEGQRPVSWTGPSIGFDVGGDANKVFALVYDLNDTEDLFKRYPAAEGKAYFVGGFTANYLQRDDVVIVPIKLGVGLRLGVNGGYMKFTKKGNWQPF